MIPVNNIIDPDIVDITSTTTIYEGWKYGAGYKIRKTVITSVSVTRTWTEGAWADRATLTYA
jgi:hypothetical protein